MEQLLSVEQVASLLAVSIPTVRRMTKDGRIPHTKVGQQIRYRRSDVPGEAIGSASITGAEILVEVFGAISFATASFPPQIAGALESFEFYQNEIYWRIVDSLEDAQRLLVTAEKFGVLPLPVVSSLRAALHSVSGATYRNKTLLAVHGSAGKEKPAAGRV